MPDTRLPDRDRRIDAAAELLRTYFTEGRSRTDLLKLLAEIVVDLRGETTLRDGRADLGGRSKIYRDKIAEVYRLAGIPAEAADGVQTALRYHVNNLLHERFTTEDLTDAGMGAVPAKVRLTAERDAGRSYMAMLKDPAQLPGHIAELAAMLSVEALNAEGNVKARESLLVLEEASERLAAVIAELQEGSSEG